MPADEDVVTSASLCGCLHVAGSHDVNGKCRACDCEKFVEAPEYKAPPPPPPPPCSECRYGRIRTELSHLPRVGRHEGVVTVPYFMGELTEPTGAWVKRLDDFLRRSADE